MYRKRPRIRYKFVSAMTDVVILNGFNKGTTFSCLAFGSWIWRISNVVMLSRDLSNKFSEIMFNNIGSAFLGFTLFMQ